jgi:DNA mismatch repair protein MutS
MPKSKGPTPVMKQFWEAKKLHPNAIMLFRMGDFYETFDDDAVLTSEILSITLTKRSNGAASTIPLAGFPYHSLEQHLHKLLKAGHRVAICEQVEDPKKAKGIVKREVVEVLSPGTALSEKYLDGRENNYLAAIVFQKEIVGISILDHSTGEFHCGEWPISGFKNVIQQFQVKEILVSEGQEPLCKSRLRDSQIFLSTFPDWVVDRDTGYDILTDHFKTNSLKGFGIEALNAGLCAAGAALHYVGQNFQNRIKHITSISFIQDESAMGLDPFTVRNLEVFSSLATQGIHGSLIGVMDKTVTSSGSRLLKSWLRRPLTDIKKIKTRLGRVQEFFDRSELLESVRDLLREVSDIDRILARLATIKATPRDVVNLGASLSKIPQFKQALKKDVFNLNSLVSSALNTSKIVDKINTVLKEEAPISLQKGGAINDGYSSELDELRQLSTNANEWLVKMQIEEQNSTGIPSLKVGYNRVFGYYIEVTKVHIQKVPEHYIRKQTLTNAERFFTPELKEYEEKILSASEKIVEIESKFFENLCIEILASAREIQFNALIISKIDVASSLAYLAVENNYICPTISNSSKLILENARHPVVETLLPMGEDFIPNDIDLNCSKKQIAIITGPNMAGKSTYLRQTGLIVLMAQVGSFVPASKATIGVIDKLFTRVGASDNLAGGESTFLVEMNETANILNNATPKSLIILDEIGRGTSTYDGLSIAWAVTEYLHHEKNVQAKTLFATHYHELVELAVDLPRAFNLNVAVKEFGDRIIFLRKIIEGGADRSYGVHVAEMAGLPKSVVVRAHDLLKTLSNSERSELVASESMPIIEQMDIFTGNNDKLQLELNELDINTMTPLDALAKLDELKKKHGV